MGSKGKAKRVRLFVAAELPDDVRSTISEGIAPLLNEVPGARWVPPENWHVTVKFLGATEPSTIPWIETQIGEVLDEYPPAGLEIEGLVFFAPPRRPPMLHAALRDPDRELATLADKVAGSLEPTFPKEKRKFRPHVTLARAWIGPARVGVLLEKVPFTVERVGLFRSDLSGERPVYERIREFSLGP
jgi:2'-5' RNA ligase